MAERLIEPLGLLYGTEGHAACAAGMALLLAGGPAAFSLCALIDGTDRCIVPLREVPEDWTELRSRITTRPPAAGLPQGVLAMGILNVTPDSFSDGGRYEDAPGALGAARRMLEQGAALIDVGGESTRPGAALVMPDAEQARILPVIRELAAWGAAVSVDTRHAATMRAALGAGALVINDVSALAHDPQARRVVAKAGCPVVLMHMRGTPETMAGLTSYDDVAVDVVRELAWSVDQAILAGIARDRIIVDPGIGFAKTEAQNLELLRRLPILANLGCRVLLGVSRKGFIGRIGEASLPTDRLAGSIVAALPGLVFPDTILRVHDVAETVQAVRLWQAIHG
ncbi:MAG: dihydropteroate synthase [Janthinobacterium lividum]